MEIIDLLEKQDIWEEFLMYKKIQANMRAQELADLETYIVNKEYQRELPKIANGILPHPQMKEINKKGVNRKRTVFFYEKDIHNILKLIAYLLKKYDALFAENLYSFRRETGVKKAISQIQKKVDFQSFYCYKADIHDYFNSVDSGQMILLLEKNLPEEPKLLALFRGMLTDPYAYKEDRLIEVKKGIMAGVATSGFLANLYLMELDYWFSDRKIPYIRYSDDIIVFAEEEKRCTEYEHQIKGTFARKQLMINPGKETRTVPGEPVEFLGFRFSEQSVDVSAITEKKLKDKLRRKARALYRWKIRKKADNERTVRAYIRFLNQKFYDNPVRGEITWCRWYFPVITTDETLKKIDEYAIACIRYLYTGKHGKKNYALRYETIKGMGFRSLVNNYWKFQKGKYEI